MLTQRNRPPNWPFEYNCEYCGSPRAMCESYLRCPNCKTPLWPQQDRNETEWLLALVDREEAARSITAAFSAGTPQPLHLPTNPAHPPLVAEDR